MNTTAPVLEHIWLCEVMAELEARETLPESMQIGLDVETLRLEPLASNRCAVVVGLSLDLLAPDTEALLADLSASFRLIYRLLEPLEGLAAQKRFAAQTGLADTWPLWRTWAQTTFTLMGLSPPPLSPRLPRALKRAASEAFDLCLELAGHDD